MDCRELREMMDSYISDELLIETNHDVLRHIENCAACRGEMADRRLLKTSLRRAVIAASDSSIDPVFMSRMTTTLKETALRPNWTERVLGGRYASARMLVFGAACAFLVVVGLIWLNRPGTVDNNSDIANAVKASWTELAKLAVGDHEDCAVEFKLKEDPISLDEAATKYGSYNKDLDSVMMTAFRSASDTEKTGDVEFIEAHSCVYDGRRFAHVVVRQKGEMVSILVTDTDLPGENYSVRSAILDTAAGAAGFLAGHHAVFVVSRLTPDDNSALARALAPAIRSHLQKPTG